MWMVWSKEIRVYNLSTGGKSGSYYQTYGGDKFIMDSNEENLYFTSYYQNSNTHYHRIYKYNISIILFH